MIAPYFLRREKKSALQSRKRRLTRVYSPPLLILLWPHNPLRHTYRTIPFSQATLKTMNQP